MAGVASDPSVQPATNHSREEAAMKKSSGPKAGKYGKAKSMRGINPRSPTAGGKAKKFGGKG